MIPRPCAGTPALDLRDRCACPLESPRAVTDTRASVLVPRVRRPEHHRRPADAPGSVGGSPPQPAMAHRGGGGHVRGQQRAGPAGEHPSGTTLTGPADQLRVQKGLAAFARCKRRCGAPESEPCVRNLMLRCKTIHAQCCSCVSAEERVRGMGCVMASTSMLLQHHSRWQRLAMSSCVYLCETLKIAQDQLPCPDLVRRRSRLPLPTAPHLSIPESPSCGPPWLT